MKLSAAVLAGGMSSRMGREKAFIELNRRPLIMRVTDRLWACADEVFVVAKQTHEFDRLGLRAVPDGTDAHTPLAGIAAALRAAAHPLVFVCACDMPFVSPDVVRLIASHAADHHVAVPVLDGRPEPLHAVWSREAAAHIEAAIEREERAVHRLFESLRVALIPEEEWRTLDPRARSFVNLNSPEELDQASAAERTASATASSDEPFPTATPSS